MSRIESDEELNESPNVEAILKWVDARRPDCSKSFREIISKGRQRGSMEEAIFLLMAISFQAGRAYQNEHKDIDPELFHRF